MFKCFSYNFIDVPKVSCGELHNPYGPSSHIIRQKSEYKL